MLLDRDVLSERAQPAVLLRVCGEQFSVEVLISEPYVEYSANPFPHGDTSSI